MAGSHAWDYAFIRTCIFLLRLVAPLSVAYALASLLVPIPFKFPIALKVWLSLEAVFYLAIYLPLKHYLQRPAKHPTPPCRDDRRKLFWRCHTKIPDPEQYLRKWFRYAPASEIKREDVKDFFRWAFLYTAESDPIYDVEIEEYARELEKLLGRKLEAGRGNAKCFRLTLDPVEMLHRSLIWYLCVCVVDMVASIYLRHHSFNFHRTSHLRFLTIFPLRPFTLFATYRSPGKTLTYWHRPHTSRTRLPILFIHGIGIGLYPYIKFLADLNAHDGEDSDGQVGIIAIEIMSISSRITTETMLKDDTCDEVDRILKAHGWKKFVLVSHSYGSVVAAHLLRNPQIARKIGPVLFVDPVSFLLHLPDVAYNFICRKPSRASELLLSYFGSKDMGVSHTLFRRFFWADNVLWKEDIQHHPVTVVLAGRDVIVDAKSIGAYLTSSDDWALDTRGWKDGIWKGNGLDVLWFEDLDHGQAFDETSARSRLVEIVGRFCKIRSAVFGLTDTSDRIEPIDHLSLPR